MAAEKTKNNRAIKLLLKRAKNLSKQIDNSLNDSHTQEPARYTAYKIYIEQYEQLSKTAEKVLMLPKEVRFRHYNVQKIKGQFDTALLLQKELMESVKVNIDDIILKHLLLMKTMIIWPHLLSAILGK